MKKILFLFLLTTMASLVMAQVQNPVKWSFTSKKISNGVYEVHLLAIIEQGFHIYAQATPAGGPVPTAITFLKNPLLIFLGSVKEMGKLEQHNEPLFGVDVKQFSNKVDFVQRISLITKAKTAVKGSIEFMVCNDKQCLPPKTVAFNIPFK